MRNKLGKEVENVIQKRAIPMMDQHATFTSFLILALLFPRFFIFRRHVQLWILVSNSRHYPFEFGVLNSSQQRCRGSLEKKSLNEIMSLTKWRCDFHSGCNRNNLSPVFKNRSRPSIPLTPANRSRQKVAYRQSSSPKPHSPRALLLPRPGTWDSRGRKV